MLEYLDTFNKIMALGTIFIQVIILLIVVNFIFFRSKENKILFFFKKYTFVFGFLIAFGAVAISLFYSEIVGYPACELCWIQRIFLYPQLILFSMELYKRDRSIVDFSIIFAILGSLVSIYHIFIEMGGQSNLSCADPSVTTEISCATRYIFEFGYITIPIMALTLSLSIIAILLNYKYLSKIK
jgi:disulfide bond formation protein DsbB